MTDPDRIDPAAALVALANSLHRGELPPENVRAFVTRAVTAWLDGLDLAAAFQLRPAAASFAERDKWLRAAAAHVDGDARRLAQEIARQDRRHDTDSPLSIAINRAATSGRRLPRSAKQLRRILSRAA
ncbi:MAG: hypothetical protein K9L32_12760 [Chromatiaceae bacterium]|nr:hypothetical protein [Chromatiaceae bacterium]